MLGRISFPDGHRDPLFGGLQGFCPAGRTPQRGIGCPRPGAEGPSAPPETCAKTDTPNTQEVSDAAATVEALARALELHDYRRGHFGETAAHAARVTQFALMLAEQVAPQLALDPQLAYGFRLHDIGMIGVSNATLLKPGPLSPAELDEIREHPWLGERIVAPVPALGGLARQVIAGHHERWDGSGLSARAARHRDPARRADLRGRRRLRRDHERPALPRRHAARSGLRGDPVEGRPRLRSRRRRRLPAPRRACVDLDRALASRGPTGGGQGRTPGCRWVLETGRQARVVRPANRRGHDAQAPDASDPGTRRPARQSPGALARPPGCGAGSADRALDARPVRGRLEARDAAVLPRRVHLRGARPLARARPLRDPRPSRPFPGDPRAAARSSAVAVLLDRDGLPPGAGRERRRRLARRRSHLPARPLARARSRLQLPLRRLRPADPGGQPGLREPRGPRRIPAGPRSGRRRSPGSRHAVAETAGRVPRLRDPGHTRAHAVLRARACVHPGRAAARTAQDVSRAQGGGARADSRRGRNHGRDARLLLGRSLDHASERRVLQVVRAAVVPARPRRRRGDRAGRR